MTINENQKRTEKYTFQMLTRAAGKGKKASGGFRPIEGRVWSISINAVAWRIPARAERSF
jgi:hypothetical protein